MQVYIELALIENFCMDFTLLYCAKIVCKNPAHILRVICAAAIGACFAVIFPLFKLSGVWAVVVKVVSGLAICFLGGKFKNFKAYAKMAAAFLGFTFVLGGAIIAIFALTGKNYLSGAGYVLSSVPIGIPLFGVLILIIVARKIAAKFKKADKTEVDLKIFSGEKCVSLSGFFDSGNRVYHRGRPVSVIPLTAALKIIDESRIKDSVKIHTVAGSKKLKIFTADKIEISAGDKINTVKDAIIGISPYAASGAVLHPDILEE
ncbi:MAG: sigma-E processing peptidase SpoIIGA [Clostridia bacterium]|nr:sigma-E processing peptidase SpoIIGA [Clostridia bacterium]